MAMPVPTVIDVVSMFDGRMQRTHDSLASRLNKLRPIRRFNLSFVVLIVFGLVAFALSPRHGFAGRELG